MLQTVDDVIARLPPSPRIDVLPAPVYHRTTHRTNRAGLAVEAMKREMTDEGWQIFAGLQHAGYKLCGERLPIKSTNVQWILQQLKPAICVLQDKREWDVTRRDYRWPRARFQLVEQLRRTPSTFSVTILKDAHQKPEYHRQAAEEIGCHAWIIYYHPRIVKHLAPYIRPEHCVRTYHTLDRNVVPAYRSADRKGTLLSGAASAVYPFRKLLIGAGSDLPEVTYIKHPGYHAKGCATPQYLQELTKYKVAICTSSMYGYALRKLIEATACGCIVLTDLPTDEVLPEIDGNLVRVPHMCPIPEVADKLRELYASYDPERQAEFARRALAHYDFRTMGQKLADDLEQMRRTYAPATPG